MAEKTEIISSDNQQKTSFETLNKEETIKLLDTDSKKGLSEEEAKIR